MALTRCKSTGSYKAIGEKKHSVARQLEDIDERLVHLKTKVAIFFIYNDEILTGLMGLSLILTLVPAALSSVRALTL